MLLCVGVHCTSNFPAFGTQLELREDELELSLDERRNKLLFADIVISVVGVCFALIGAVAGIFGMNLPSGWFLFR